MAMEACYFLLRFSCCIRCNTGQLSKPTFVCSYAPVTDHSKTAPYVRYISSRLYIKIFQRFS